MPDNLKSIIHNLPLIVIVGPTSSGKTKLAIDIAKKFNGEIICADSRTIYRYMDIGTAKPSLAERAAVPHWGLDIVDPVQKYSASDFKNYANIKIDEIRKRGKIPFLVGGSGLYVDSVVLDYQFGDEADNELRVELEALDIDELYKICAVKNIKLPENYKNKRYVIRCIENNGKVLNTNRIPINNCIVVGIATDKDILIERIAKRTDELMSNGIIEESEFLAIKFGWNNESMKANIYPLVKLYLEHNITEKELVNLNNIADWQLAKRQITWFKRDKFIKWLNREDAYKYLCSELASSDIT